MFRWYRDSKICYVYLADVDSPEPTSAGLDTIDNHQFEHSRWFRRGWTLQELIAPTDVVFYSKDWHQLGRKAELSYSISKVTKIDQLFLDSRNLPSASIAQKMSWAANRETSRPEDISYCLLGIFDVNMPLIYGEGTKAFQRLQDEIMKAYPYDLTILAWGKVLSKLPGEVNDLRVVYGDEPMDSVPSITLGHDGMLGLLAKSPRDFEFSGEFVSAPDSESFFDITEPVIQRSGARFKLKLARSNSLLYVSLCQSELLGPQIHRVWLAILPCGFNRGAFYYATLPILLGQSSFNADAHRLPGIIIGEQFTSDQCSCIELRPIRVLWPIAPYTPTTTIKASDILIKRMWRSSETFFTNTRGCYWYGNEGIYRWYHRVNGSRPLNLFTVDMELDDETFYILVRAYPAATTITSIISVMFYHNYDPLKLFISKHDPPPFFEQEMTPCSPYTPVIDLGLTRKARVGVETVFLNDDPSRPVYVVDIVIADKEMIPYWWLEPLTLPESESKSSSSESEIQRASEADRGCGSGRLMSTSSDDERGTAQEQSGTVQEQRGNLLRMADILRRRAGEGVMRLSMRARKPRYTRPAKYHGLRS